MFGLKFKKPVPKKAVQNAKESAQKIATAVRNLNSPSSVSDAIMRLKLKDGRNGK